MRRMLLTATAAIALLGAGAVVLAQAQPQQSMPMMQGQGMRPAMPMMQGHGAVGHAATPAPANATPATRAFIAANDKMHRDMAITYSGNADRDFVADMIPHHQGAIDMANVVLRYGTDPEMRALAQAVIQAQTAEIAQLRAYLARTAPR